jgi:hypothetical protein
LWFLRIKKYCSIQEVTVLILYPYLKRLKSLCQSNKTLPLLKGRMSSLQLQNPYRKYPATGTRTALSQLTDLWITSGCQNAVPKVQIQPGRGSWSLLTPRWKPNSQCWHVSTYWHTCWGPYAWQLNLLVVIRNFKTLLWFFPEIFEPQEFSKPIFCYPHLLLEFFTLWIKRDIEN